MKKIIYFILFIFVGCNHVDENLYNVDPLIQPYLDNFYSIASSKYGDNFNRTNLLIMVEYGLADQFNSDGLTTLRSNGGQRQIEFDLDFWQSASESERQVLTLHEFGHAFLGRIHTNDFSIMNPKMGNKGWPLCNTQECDHKILLDELFRK